MAGGSGDLYTGSKDAVQDPEFTGCPIAHDILGISDFPAAHFLAFSSFRMGCRIVSIGFEGEREIMP